MDQREWLKQAIGEKDSFSGIFEHNNFAVATDGYRLHAVETKRTLEAPVWQKAEEHLGGEIATILLDSDYLRDALPDSGVITLIIRSDKRGGPPLIEVGYNSADGNRYALIMPRVGDQKSNIWRPFDISSDPF